MWHRKPLAMHYVSDIRGSLLTDNFVLKIIFLFENKVVYIQSSRSICIFFFLNTSSADVFHSVELLVSSSQLISNSISLCIYGLPLVFVLCYVFS